MTARRQVTKSWMKRVTLTDRHPGGRSCSVVAALDDDFHDEIYILFIASALLYSDDTH